MTRTFVTAIALCTATLAWADGDHSAPRKEFRANPDSAVTAFDAEEGFKVNEQALSTLGVRFQALAPGKSWTIPRAALVQIKHTTGVFRRFEGWISFVLVQAGSQKNGVVQIHSEDLQAGDEVAVEGAAFLRMTEADLNADTVDNCAH